MKTFIRLRGCVILCWLLLAVWPARANDWNGPAADLAKVVAATTGPGTISVAIANSSSISKDQLAAIQKAIEAHLLKAGVQVGSVAGMNKDVRITLSENIKEYVWVAEIREANTTKVQMVTIPRPQSVAAPRNGPTVTINKALLWKQPNQILDVLLTDASSSSARMFVLDTNAITAYSIRNGNWQHERQWPVGRTGPLPRDARGLLVAGKDRAIEVFLPGTACRLSGDALVCHDSDDPWKIGRRAAFFNSGRNYFTGVMVPDSGSQTGPFYSAAWLETQPSPLLLISGIDGRFHALASATERTFSPTVTASWGSDLAGVKSNCGIGTQLLVTSSGGDDTRDSLRAFEVTDGDPMQVSFVADFPGPITALWSHDATSAIVVTRNLQTGFYEAYSVSITCNQ